MSRSSCLDCSRKHIAAAEVLMTEALLSYPLHAWLAVGHLEQAESELLSDFPNMAYEIRKERVQYIEGLTYVHDDNTIRLQKCDHNIDTMKLLEKLTYLSIGQKTIANHVPKKNK